MQVVVFCVVWMCHLITILTYHISIFIDDVNTWMRGQRGTHKNWAITNLDDSTVQGFQQRWLRYLLHKYHTWFTASRNLSRITRMTAPTHSTSRWPSCDHAPQLIVPLQQRELIHFSVQCYQHKHYRKITLLIIQMGKWNHFVY